jgi:phosphohistidine phosphatase
VVLRHAKSDWDVQASDRLRPLAKRGVRQAREAGEWLRTHGPVLEVALVSPATRAQQTWQLAGDPEVDRRDVEEVYTFDGSDLVAVVRTLRDVRSAALVGHNPAVEELIHALTGQWVEMPTSCLAVVELDDWTNAGDRSGRLVAHGRPPA